MVYALRKSGVWGEKILRATVDFIRWLDLTGIHVLPIIISAHRVTSSTCLFSIILYRWNNAVPTMWLADSQSGPPEWSNKTLPPIFLVCWCPRSFRLATCHTVAFASTSVSHSYIYNYCQIFSIWSSDFIWYTCNYCLINGGLWKHTVFVDIHNNDGRLFTPALCDCSSQTYFIV